jgi:uncharacterized protein (DUF3820 family)
MALHPETPDGEIQNAAVLLIKILRKRNFSPEMLLGTTAKPQYKPEPPPKPKPKPKPKYKEDAGDVVFSFGKHKGKKISEVPSDYLQWIHNWISNGEPELQKNMGWLLRTIEEYWNE